jgi:hypothetical protein
MWKTFRRSARSDFAWQIFLNWVNELTPRSLVRGRIVVDDICGKYLPEAVELTCGQEIVAVGMCSDVPFP